MSAWVVLLALSAGYLVNKNLQMKDTLEQASTKFEGAAEPASPGPTSKDIRSTLANPDLATGKSGGKYDDFNQGSGTSRAGMNQILDVQRSAVKDVEAYEAPALPEIQGVMMLRDNYGI